MVDLALATNVPPSAWLAEPDELIATALANLERRAERAKARRQERPRPK